MDYITLDELKDVLPAIMDQWMDGGDESWEWIFQEIEQKCHVGKRKKDKKKHKKYIEKIDELTKKVDDVIPKIMGDFDARINAQTKRIDGLSNKISHLSVNHTAMASRVDRVERDIKATKSMAQTAKQRTEVDYAKCSKEKSDADVVQEVYNRMSGRGATFEELNTFRNLIQKYDALEKKEVPVTRKACETCKSYAKNPFEQPCSLCCYNGINTDLTGLDKWEAKDNG